MATNDFFPFATGVGANVITQAEYAALTALIANGFQTGTALSQQLNKVWRQSSFVSAALAQLMADATGANVQDDGVILNFEKLLALAVNLVNYGVDSGTTNAYAVTYAVPQGTITDGQRLRFLASSTNTGASTFSANGATAHPIWTRAHAPLVGGEIVANGDNTVVWNASLNGGSGAWVLVENSGGSAGFVPEDSSTGAASLPVGTTAQRPVNGMGKIRFNSTLLIFEGNNGGGWSPLGGVGGSYAGVTSFAASTTLSASDFSQSIYFSGSTASQTIALPAANSGSAGSAITLTNRATVAVTISRSGGDTISLATPNGAVSANSFVLAPGDSVVLVSDGVSNWAQGSLRVQAQAVQGSFKNLALSTTGTNATVAASADELTLKDANGVPLLLRNVSVSINSAASGANGLDTGALAASTWYAVWVASNGVGAPIGLISLSPTSPTLPAGYTHKARIGWICTDSSGNKYPLSIKQMGRKVRYVVAAGSNVAAPISIASGTAGNIATPTWSAISVSPVVPSTASVFTGIQAGIGGTAGTIIAPNSAYGAYNSATNPPPYGNTSTTSYGGITSMTFDILLESTNIYWASSVATNKLFVHGWEDNL